MKRYGELGTVKFITVFAEQALVAGLGGYSAARVLIDVGNHAEAEDRFAVEKRLHRARENGIDVALACPPAKGTVNAGEVDFRLSITPICNWQRFPLAPHVELLQVVVGNLVRRQCDRWSSAPTLQMRQDKCLKLLETQNRWNPLPMRALRHFACQSGRILPQATCFTRIQCLCGLPTSCFNKDHEQLVKGYPPATRVIPFG